MIPAMDGTAFDSWFVDMDFESCLITEEAHKTTTSKDIPFPSTSSVNSLFAEGFTELILMMEEDDDENLRQPPPPNKLQEMINGDCLSLLLPPTVPEITANTVHNKNGVVPCSSTPIILDFRNGNSSTADNAVGKKKDNLVTSSRDLHPDEEAFVSEALRLSQNAANNNNNDVVVTENLRCVEVMKKRSRVRLPSENYEHSAAERRRREQISEKFVALSTMVPGLKKLDKTSVLSDTMKYLKQLQDKITALEAQAEKYNVESFFLVKKSATMLEDGGGGKKRALPEIEGRLFNNQILLRIQCRKRSGVIADLFRELEELKLSIVSTNAATFGNFAIDATIIAEMATGFNATMKEVVKRLRAVV